MDSSPKRKINPMVVHDFSGNSTGVTGDSLPFRYPHPFIVRNYAEHDEPPPNDIEDIKTQEKMKRPDVLARWQEEARSSQQNERLDRKLTENMINYVFAELEAYAKLADPKSGIQDIVQALMTAVARLEDVPEAQKDWHPGSNGQVLDLVHPSLYCLVYGRSLVRDAQGNVSVATVDLQQLRSVGDASFASERYAWLPSDFAVDEDGRVRLSSPYINNLHKSNKELYEIIPTVLSHFIPMFERVLGAIDKTDRPRTRGPFLGNHRAAITSRGDPDKIQAIEEYLPLPGRIKSDEDGDLACFWGEDDRDEDAEAAAEENEFEGYPGGNEEERRFAWVLSQPTITLPDAPEVYGGALERDFRVANLRGRTVQCIVKLANIHLTPEKPEYPGGNWHVEGMINERIVATGIYYLDSDNISESKLQFRTTVAEPFYHEQDDSDCMKVLYGQDRDCELVQERGAITTSAGLALAFPNIYQHCVSPFRLVDPTRPGHRKILAFFLVEPNQRVPSTSDVAPQQVDWMLEFTHDSTVHGAGRTRFGTLPVELRKLIVEKTDGLMTAKEANRVREELMKERSRNVQRYNKEVMGLTFNMCEH
ncbi:hypothetical protein BXZ70DRAFT_1073353 [Cristinia sonorae]|uniref:DUF4246 domain-containing protein n=1 Tax=Cristinia sonorae TaxID=1940300 RepID=A0A8K0XL88_9AGAR|nr:hypothetical protein BXZ70DRAFT_1073353 [Cristinia sonorae]